MGQKSILIVDDNPADVLLVKLALKPFGLENNLVNITNGQDALLYLQKLQENPEFIILDVNLPGLNGFEVLQTIRSHRHLQNIKVAMFTSAYMPEEELLKLSRPDRFIIKPFTFDEYSKVLQELCREWL